MNTDRGRTRWRRFAAVTATGAGALALLMTGVANGSIAASFAVSGTAYKASASLLKGNGVVQYGSLDDSAGPARPVVVNGFKTAQMSDFCQSINVPVPVLGDSTIRITAPGPGGMTATNLVLALDWASGDMTLTGADLGVDAGELTKGPSQGAGGTFGIQADGLEMRNLRQVAWSTTASTLRLNQVRISAHPGRAECF